MNGKHLIMIGKGGHYKVVRSLIVPDEYDAISNINHLPLPSDNINFKRSTLIIDKYLKLYPNKHLFVFIAIGFNYHRKIISNFLTNIINIKFKYAKVISKNSNVSNNVKIGSGTVIMPGVSINTDSSIGSHSIINTNSSIDHDNKILNYVSLAPGVNTGGNVTIKSLTHLGIGCKIKHNIQIDSNVLVGSNSYVDKNCSSNKVFFGSPAKFIKQKKNDYNYFNF